jgi:membrane-associated phospholipid phosphatase
MRSVHNALGRIRRPGPLVAVTVAYLALMAGLMIWRGISVSPDYLVLLLVPVAALSGRLHSFLFDWVPFVALFLGYEALAGIAPKLGIKPQVASMVRIERVIFFGQMPGAVLQRAFGSLRWLIIACAVIYFCHFLFPIGVGMVLWLTDRVKFLRFVTALLAMSFAAFIFFLLLPTAPPWYAHQAGVLPGVQDLLYGSLPSAISPYFKLLDADTVASFPSLHAAYPTLGALALWQVNRRTAIFMVPWCLAVWFTVVFLGQHYVIDVLGGVILAVVTWAVMDYLVVPRVRAFQPRPLLAAGAQDTGAEPVRPGSQTPVSAGDLPG